MRKYLIGIWLAWLLWLCQTVFSQYIELDNNVFQGFNAGIQNNFSSLLWQYGGNMFVGATYWNTPVTVSPQTITVWSQTITGCTQQLRGLYFNNQRWWRMWPLDQQSLAAMQAIDSSYNNLTLTGGLYTNCSGVTQTNVYGYIQHNRSGTLFHLIAGVNYNLANNTYTSAFDSTLQFSNLSAQGHLFDPLGGIAAITSIINATGFNAWFQFPSLYTNTISNEAYVYATEPAGFVFGGDTQWTFWGTMNTSALATILITPGDGVKTIQATFTSLGNGQVDGHVAYLTLDTVNPTVSIQMPSVSWYVYTGNTGQFLWSGSDVNGITWYYSYITNATNNIIASTQWPATNWTITTLGNGNYRLHVTAYDAAGNTASTGRAFSITGSTNNITGFTLPTILDLDDADIDTVYTSEPIFISNVPGTYLAQVTEWVLVINGEAVGTTWYVTNGDVVEIELISSDDYEKTVTATLTINNLTTLFSVTTVEEGDEPDPDDYCERRSVYLILLHAFSNVYDGNTPRLINVLELMLDMINDTIDDLIDDGEDEDADKLQCFGEIVDDYLIDLRSDSEDNMTERTYTAPNGKVYKIRYLEDRKVYTSPDFKDPKFYISYETLTKLIDKNNPKKSVWDHTSLDTSFAAVTVTAPNSKIFKVQKTNKWFMSYNFINPKYFPSLDAIKAHINQTNPKK